MKRIAFLTTVALSLCALSSCTEDSLGLDVVGGNKGDIIITTDPFSKVESLTRTDFTPGKDSVRVCWATGDKIGIVPDGGRQIYFDVDPTKGITEKAVFDGRAWNLRDFATYYAYYPFSNVNNSDEISVENIHFTLATQVIKNSWGNTDHLGAADLLVGSGNQPENSALKIQFNHLCALVRFTLDLKNVSIGEEITQFQISVPNEYNTFIYDAEVNLKDDNPHLVARTGGSSNSWAINFENVTKEWGNDIVSFYAILPPAQLKDKTLEAELTTKKDGRYQTTSFYCEMQQNLVAGKAYDLEMTYDQYTPVIRMDGTQVIWLGNKSDSIVLVPIKPHVFDMGIVTGQTQSVRRWQYDNATQVTTTAVVANEFYIGQTEVTQGQWKAVMGQLPCAQPIEDDSYPVVGMDFNTAHLFCKKLSAMTGRRFHLPSDAQWQLAAMSSNSTELASFIYPGSNKQDDVVIYDQNAPHGHMALARSGSTNGAGLYNMGGNVKEIIYNYAEAPVNDIRVNYFGPAHGDEFITRGAGWKTSYSDAKNIAMVTCPGERHPISSGGSDDIGLRVVCADEIIETVNDKWQFAYGYVDLGLPSGTLWATADLSQDFDFKKGKVNLVDYQIPFMKEVSFSANIQIQLTLHMDHYYSFYDDVDGSRTSTDNDDYCPSNPSSAQCLQGSKKLAIESQMGEHWSTPSQAQWIELFKHTSMTHANSVAILTSGANGKSIYFRMAGYANGSQVYKDWGEYAAYWSSDYDPVTSWATDWIVNTVWTSARAAIMDEDNDKESDRWGTSNKLKMRAVVNPNTTQLK